MPPPSADRPIASAAPRPSHLSRSARVASIAWAKAGFADRKTTTAVPKAARGANSLDMRRIGKLLVGAICDPSPAQAGEGLGEGSSVGREISGKSIWFLVFFVSDGLADVHGGQQRKD